MGHSSHALSDVAPTALLYRPAGHFVHCDAPSAENQPAGQATCREQCSHHRGNLNENSEVKQRWHHPLTATQQQTHLAIDTLLTMEPRTASKLHLTDRRNILCGEAVVNTTIRGKARSSLAWATTVQPHIRYRVAGHDVLNVMSMQTSHAPNVSSYSTWAARFAKGHSRRIHS